jgi:hypothetical protein
MENERSVLEAKSGDVFICVGSSLLKDRIGEMFIVHSRKRCQHKDKDKIQVVAKGWLELCWGYGDNFKLVKT